MNDGEWLVNGWLMNGLMMLHDGEVMPLIAAITIRNDGITSDVLINIIAGHSRHKIAHDIAMTAATINHDS